MSRLERAIGGMTAELSKILGEPTIYLYGSVTIGDFCEGWSDIDILILTEEELTDNQTERLLLLRQEMELQDPIYRSFEGGIIKRASFIDGIPSKTVYWGTSGQRITDGYTLDVFSRYLLKKRGVLLCGEDISEQILLPSYNELYEGVVLHVDSIHKYAHTTGDSLYTCGWLLDISRGLYTVETGDVISKTEAAKWALERDLCPDPNELKRTLTVRQNPLKFKDDPETKAWISGLVPAIQRYCGVLDDALLKRRKT